VTPDRANGQRIFTGFIRDLTARQKMEAELRQSQQMEAIGQLTGGVAHDFNNLLTVIAGNLEMLEANLKDDPQREMLREAQDAVQDGAKLTAQLLAFGRRQPLNPKPTDVGPLVSNFAELLRRTLGEAIELSIVTTGSAHLAVVDAPQLQNAPLNLVINARDALPDGGRLTIEISHARLDADYAQAYADVRAGRYVLIAVTDTGVGGPARAGHRIDRVPPHQPFRDRPGEKRRDGPARRAGGGRAAGVLDATDRSRDIGVRDLTHGHRM
jgi:signal transduction histidine kinase